MNEDLKAVVEEICSLIHNHHKGTKVYYELDYSPVPERLIDGLVKYGDTIISDLIPLIRIERLYDLKIINEKDKQTLIEAYNKFKELESDINSKKHSDEYNPMLEESVNLLRDKLVKLGIIEEFNYEEAFINEIDAKLKSKYIRKKTR